MARSKVLLDTNVSSILFKGDSPAAANIDNAKGIGLSSAVIGAVMLDLFTEV